MAAASCSSAFRFSCELANVSSLADSPYLVLQIATHIKNLEMNLTTGIALFNQNAGINRFGPLLAGGVGECHCPIVYGHNANRER